MGKIFLLVLVCGAALSSCASVASSEEYYAMGMAYYEMGEKAATDAERAKAFENAQKWLERASSVKSTTRASEYNLGRIAYESKRYSIAIKHFEKLIKADPKNVMALKAAAYTEIKLGNLDSADEYYARVLELEPESTDNGFNYALVLYAEKRYAQAETVLLKYRYAMPDNKDTLLLLARCQRAQNKIEAIDNYALWLVKNTDPVVRFEYAQALSDAEYYARAIEELKKTVTECTATTETATFKKSTVQFTLARLILIADPASEEGITTLQAAVDAGYDDVDALAALAKDSRLSKARQASVSTILSLVIARKEQAAQGGGATGSGTQGSGSSDSGTQGSDPKDSGTTGSGATGSGTDEKESGGKS